MVTATPDAPTARTRGIIVKNGVKVVQEGDRLSAIAPFKITKISVIQDILIDGPGSVIWHGEWDGPQGESTGLFVNDQLLVQEGITTVDGDPIVSILDWQPVHPTTAVSDNGRYILFRGTAGFLGSVFEIRLDGSIEPMPGCSSNLGTLEHVGGTPFGGDTLAFEMDQAQSVGASAFLLFSLAPTPTWPPCGVPLRSAGELLIDVGAPNLVFSISDTWNGSPTPFDIPIPPNESQIGLQLYSQGLFVDPQSITEPFRLTAGLQVTLGDFL